MISRSGTRKSSDANELAVKQGFDFAQRSAGFSEVFRLPLRKIVTSQRIRTHRLLDCRRNVSRMPDRLQWQSLPTPPEYVYSQ